MRKEKKKKQTFCEHMLFITSFNASGFGQQLHFAVVGSRMHFNTAQMSLAKRCLSQEKALVCLNVLEVLRYCTLNLAGTAFWKLNKYTALQASK